MKNIPLVISFFTQNTPYQWHADALIKSCKELDIDHDVEGIPSAGSWEINCAFKPIFILKMLKKHKRPLLWLDCDATIERNLEFTPAFTADVAVRISPECASDHPSKIYSGTLFINYTQAAIDLITQWATKSMQELEDKNRKEEFWDQTTLKEVIKNFSESIEIGLLPIEYLKIFDHPIHEELCKNPIIVQHQASRLLKKWIV